MNVLRPTIQKSMSALVKPSIRHMLQNSCSRSMTILSKQSAEEYKNKSYTARMEKTGRPVSPHVTIYSFPITALTSITNRVCGISLSFGAFSIALIELLGGSGSSLDFAQYIGQMDDSILIPATAKAAVAFPFVYHYLGGLRHVYWDMTPDVLTTSDVEKSSMLMVGGAIILTSGLIFV